MVGDLALCAFFCHVERYETVAFRFQERIEFRSASNRTISDFHARQQRNKTLQTIGCDRFTMCDHHHLLGTANDAQQFDGLDMRGRIDDDDVSQRRRIGNRR